MKRQQTTIRPTIIIALAFCVYAALFIYNTSFIVGGTRYFCLFDDAMISMRYARNFVDGLGLVMNAGERVEGITNPLWTMVMALIHLSGVSQPQMSLLVQIVAAASLLAGLFTVNRISRRISNDAQEFAAAPVFLTAFYLPLINWSLQGMEVGLQTLLMCIIILRAFKALEDRTVPWDLYVLLGVGTLVRIDMTVQLVGITAFLAILNPEARKRHILYGCVTLALFLGGQTIARLIYYGVPFPNTYYLKMTGYPVLLRLTRGFYVWLRFMWGLNAVFVLLTAAMVAFRFTARKGLLAVVIGLQMCYSIYVGGDAWEDWGGSNRYIAFIMPAFFILFADSVRIVLRAVGGHLSRFGDRAVQRIGWIIIVIAFLQFNNNSGSLSLPGMLFFKKPAHVENNRDMVERALILRQITKADASVAVTWAGIIPYFSERYVVDILGKTDAHIARIPMRRAEGTAALTYFHPGHLKWDYAHSIGELEPDAVLQFWGDLAEAEPYIVDKYVRVVIGDKWVYLKKDSENVRWPSNQGAPQ